MKRKRKRKKNNFSLEEFICLMIYIHEDNRRRIGKKENLLKTVWHRQKCEFMKECMNVILIKCH